MADLPYGEHLASLSWPQRCARWVAGWTRIVDPVGERIFGRQVWAVAATSLSAMLRSRVTVLTLVVLVSFLLALPSCQVSGGTLADRTNQYMAFTDLLSNRVQNYLSLGLTSVYYLGSLLMVLLGAAVIVGDIQSRVIHLTLAKPISRSTFIVGKWVALALLSFGLVFGCGLLIYVRTWVLAGEHANPADRARLADQVLVARESRTLAPPAELLDRWAEQRRNQILAERGQAAATWTAEEEATLRGELKNRFYTIGPGEQRTYVFSGLRAASDLESIQIRYQPGIAGRTPNDDRLPVIFLIGNEQAASRVRVDRMDLVRTPHTFTVPAKTIAPNGDLAITVVNPTVRTDQVDWETALWLPEKDGLQVLYRVGDFGPNFLRGLVLMWAYLLLLGTLGLLFSALVSYPVAVLCACSGLMALVLVPWMAPALRFLTADLKANAWYVNLALPFSLLLSWVTPDLTRYDPTESLANGLDVPWPTVGYGLGQMVVLAGGVLIGLAMIGLYRRELASTAEG